MKKIALALVLGLVLVGGAYADDEINAVSATETVFTRYVVNPVQLAHRFTWGVLSVAYRIGKVPVDAGFKLVGQTIGTEPNTPLWE